MSPDNRDLTIDTLLNDPMILAVMRADRVDAAEWEAMMRVTALRLAASAGRAYAAPVVASQTSRPVASLRCFA